MNWEDFMILAITVIGVVLIIGYYDMKNPEGCMDAPLGMIVDQC